jgi:four helix bundle protein
MFLQLAHTKLDIFKCSRELALSCYRLTRQFPDSERFVMVQQIRRAALSVHLNIAEGCSRRSKTERIRYFEISRGSVIEVDTILDLAFRLNFSTLEELQPTGDLLIRAFSMLSALIKS